MCIWNCKEDDRKCVFCTYRGGCEMYPIEYDPSAELSKIGLGYVKSMNEIVGADILEPSRRRDVVWARNMVAYRLNQDGLSFEKIGKVLNRDHSTVFHSVMRCKDIFKYPSMYREELALWETFISNSYSDVQQN